MRPNSVGIVPDIRLSWTQNLHREVNKPTSVGIVPCRSQLFRLRDFNVESCPTIVEIVPESYKERKAKYRAAQK